MHDEKATDLFLVGPKRPQRALKEQVSEDDQSLCFVIKAIMETSIIFKFEHDHVKTMFTPNKPTMLPSSLLHLAEQQPLHNLQHYKPEARPPA